MTQQDRITAFLKALDEEFEGSAGNKALREYLEWDEEEYWEVRNAVISAGRAVPGRGKGGSTRLADPIEAEPTSEVAAQEFAAEEETYAGLIKIIKSKIAKDENYSRYFVSDCHDKGSGLWGRPDIALWGRKVFKFIAEPIIHVITYEVKLARGFDVRAVYQAASHRMFSNYSYIIVCCGKNYGELGSVDARTMAAIKEQGVGLIIVEDIDNFEEWTVEVAAEFKSPDPERLNSFIASAFAGHEDQILEAMK